MKKKNESNREKFVSSKPSSFGFNDKDILEKALARSEEKYRYLIKHARAAIYEIDFRSRRFTSINEAMCEMLGYSYDELININPLDILDGQSKIIFQERIDKWLNGEKPDTNVEYKVLTKDGHELYVILTVTFTTDENGKPMGAMVIGHDITERKRIEIELLEATRKAEYNQSVLETVIQQMPVGIILTDAEGKSAKNNEAMDRIWRHNTCPAENFDNRKYVAFHKDGRKYKPGEWPLTRSLLRGEQVAGEEMIIRRGDGTRGTVYVSSNPVRDKSGQIIAGVVTDTDITELRQAEAAVAKANENLEIKIRERTYELELANEQLRQYGHRITQFQEEERKRIAQLLHDDLQQIIVAARMQLEAAGKSIPQKSLLSHAEHLLTQAIEKSRRLSYELSPPVLYHSGLIQALKWLTGQMDAQFGLKVEINEEPDIKIENDLLKVFVFRAIQELLFNVVKHASTNNASVSLSADNNHLNITVSDEGKGFDPALLDLHSNTAGFGLLSLRERTRYISGILSIESSPGKGSTVKLSVPLALSETNPAEDNKDVLNPPASQKTVHTDYQSDIRVLFVDDHKVIRQGLTSLMHDQPKINVVGEAADGLEAIAQVRNLKPDVVVMDVSMPKMDGIEATQRIKEEWPGVCIIGLSMYEDDQIYRKMTEAGAAVFVNKAASSAELLKAIYRVTELEKYTLPSD